MKCNVGGVDRMLRMLVGVVLIGLAATGSIGVWGWIGVVPLKHRAPEFQRSKAPETTNRGFCPGVEKENPPETRAVLGSGVCLKVKISQPLVYLG